MSQIVVTFEKAWLDERRSHNVRVIRQLEKWIAQEADVSLKTSTGDSVTVDVKAALREDFLKKLAERLREMGETKPWEHVSFSGDVAGLELPTKIEAHDGAPPQSVDGGRGASDGDAEEKVARREHAGNSPRIAAEKPAAEQAPDPRETVEEICSKVPIKHSRALEEYVREIAAVIPTLQKMGVESTLWHQHLLLAVEAGYGRSEFLASLAKMYKAFGLIKGDINAKTVRECILLPKGEERNSDGYRVTWDDVLDIVREMSRANKKNGLSRAILYLDISAWESKLAGAEFKACLRRLNAMCGSFLVVFRVPFVEGHVLGDAADALNDILNVRAIAVPPAPLDDMTDYAREALAASSFALSEDAVNPFEQWLLLEKVDDSFFGYKTVDKMIQRVIYEKALSNCRKGETGRVIGCADVRAMTQSPAAEGSPREELAHMVGMGAVARQLEEVIVQIKTQKELLANGKKVPRPAIHMLFTGNPGTGKTTVARIAARMMREAGILRKGHIVEVKGRDLCGEYIGETAPKTSAICRDAYGSVLFIDEAYSLFRDEYSSSRDYGREAMDTLVAEMENHRDDFCVIMAGYKDEMEAMLKGNAGLKSRIPYEIEFPNYSRDDLERIFFSMLDGTFEYEDGLKDAVHDFFAKVPEEMFESKEFSNARFVRNLYERTWGKAAYRRSMENGGSLRILKSDLAGAAADKEFKNLLEKNAERRAIGFGV